MAVSVKSASGLTRSFDEFALVAVNLGDVDDGVGLSLLAGFDLLRGDGFGSSSGNAG